MKISVITVTYNCASFVRHCLDSIAIQSHEDIEHVIIDGASADGTLRLLQTHRSQSSVLISEPDYGIYDAMNKGLAYSSGEIIGFLNADDFYAHPAVLETVSQCFDSDPLLEICYSDLIYVDQSDVSRLVRYWKSNPFKAGSFAKGWSPPHPTFFVRSSVYDRLGGFDLSYNIAADVELMMRFLEVNELKAKYIPDVWVGMRMGGTTNKSWRNILTQNQEVLRALESNGLPSNPFTLFSNKLWSRGLQFIRTPTG